MTLAVRPTSRFRNELRRMLKAGHDIAEMSDLIQLLGAGEPLPAGYAEHALHGEYAGLSECHLSGDWLVVYRRRPAEIVLRRTGTHAQLFPHRKRV